MQETQVRSLGQEGRLQKRMVTHSSLLAWRIPWRKDWAQHTAQPPGCETFLLFWGIQVALTFDRSPGKPTRFLKARFHLSDKIWPCSSSLSSVQSLSQVQLFATPWTAACQASLSITNSWSLLKLMSVESWCHPTISSSVVPFSSCLQSFPASQSFPMISSSNDRVAKVLEFQLQHQSFQWIFRTYFLWNQLNLSSEPVGNQTG